MQKLISSFVCFAVIVALPGCATHQSDRTVASEKAPPPPTRQNIADEQIFTVEDQVYCESAPIPTLPTINPFELPDNGSVWRVGSNRWNEAHEKKFAEWVEREVDEQFFSRLEIATDCADAALSLRILYARIHQLPISIQSESGVLNSTTRQFAKLTHIALWNQENWKQDFAQDARFRKFLDEAQGRIGTGNLPANTYPIQLSQCRKAGSKPGLSSWVTPGTVLIDNQHTRFISKIDSTQEIDPVFEMSSTMPKAVRPLYKGAVEFYFGGSEKLGRGVLHFNWPVNCSGKFELVKDEKMPGYSLEQYELVGKNSAQFLVELAPGKRGKPDRNYIDLKFSELKTRLIQRLKVVEEASQALEDKPNGFSHDSPEYEDYSTPNLDQLFNNKFEDLEVIAKLNPDKRDYIQAKLIHSVIVLPRGRSMTYLEFRQALYHGYTSFNPNDPVLHRWGFSFVQKKLKILQEKLPLIIRARDLERENLNYLDQVRLHFGFIELPQEQEIAKLQLEIADLRRRGGNLKNSE